jgi:hypothetical protein
MPASLELPILFELAHHLCHDKKLLQPMKVLRDLRQRNCHRVLVAKALGQQKPSRQPTASQLAAN